MRILRIFAIALGSLVVLFVLAAVSLVLWIDPNDYRDELSALVQRETGRTLEIRGDLDLKLFPWLSLEANDVELGNPPGFEKVPFLRIQTARVGARLLPLLQRRLEVSRVAIDGLSATLVKRADGRANWEGFGDSQEPAAKSEPGIRDTTIAGLDVSNSTLVYRNEAEDTSTRLREIEMHAGSLGADRPTPIEASFIMDAGENTEAMRLALQTRAHLPANATRIELADVILEGELRGLPQAKEPPVPFTVKSPSLAIDWEAETLAPAELAIEYAGIPLAMKVQGQRLFQARELSGQLRLPRFSMRQALPRLGFALPADLPAGRLEAVEASSRFTLTERQLELPDLAATIDESRIKGRLLVEDLEAMALRFDLAIDELNVDRYFPPETEEPKAGATPAAGAAAPTEEPVELPRKLLADLDARGSLRIGRLTVAELPFEKVGTALDARRGLVRLGPTEAQLFGGGYRGLSSLDLRRTPARLTLDERVQGIDVARLMKATFESGRLSGRASASASLTAEGETDTALLRSLAGQARFDIESGAIEGVDIWYELRRARALWQREGIPAREGPPRTEFRTLAGTTTLADGVLRSDDLRAELDYVKLAGKGTMNVFTQALDYRFTAAVFRIPGEGEGAEMAAVRTAEIPLTVTGTIADPKVRPDFDVLVKARVKEEVQRAVEEKKTEIKERIQDKLKDLLGR